MKINTILPFLFVFISCIAVAQTKIELADAGKHIGETGTVCGKVYSARYLEASKNSPTLLNLGAAFPNQLLTIVLFGDVRKTLSYKPEEALNNKQVCVTGKIEDFNGKPQIVVRGEKDIKVYDEVIVQSDSSTNSKAADNNQYDRVFTKVEKEATFPGGAQGWRAYLEKNLNASVPFQDKAPAGLYRVAIQFIVSAEGVVSDVQAVEVPDKCLRCGIEAVRVIKKGPKWEPAAQNGKPVTYQAKQFITFQVEGK